MVSLYLQVVLLVLLGTSWADKRCYFPDGSGTSDNYPCDPDAEDSVCCGGARGSYCMSNKLCGNGDGNTIRGACTDPDWRTGECPFFCMSADTGGTDLISCANVTNNDASYCCDHNAGCCERGVGRFNVFPADPDIWATWDVDATKFVVVGTVFSSAKPTSTSTSESSSAEPLTTSVSSSTLTSSTLSVSSTASTSSTTDLSSQNTADADDSVKTVTDEGLSTPAIAGIASAVGVVVILAVGGAYLFWRHRRKNKQGPPPQYLQEPNSSHHHNYPASGPHSMYKEPHSTYQNNMVPNPAAYPQELLAPHPQELKPSYERAELPGL